ncbi:unnamed protein product (macronuclear) [Paramecium tetraurelia]|uniref:Uncharacterized protein n=1 Tax=Paramecium tetraurelia TaxID=5888 RepID=A0EC36_PARTE|nr:uncharacterized protein GSPATT00025589001 [Paramecium tetraurelia]CAK92853.1 unnamed protein product [Paramecium tetraurelia]|eukprot:XP_001460250.1 hypothetical protein (macronuclear) [Paramecium tetraurelia strain d4-2]
MGDIETIDDDVGSIDKKFEIGKYWGKWTYFYFGYSFHLKQAYAYIRQIDQTANSYLFEEIYHFVPNYLSVFFSEDGYGKQFDGEAFDWYLGIGDGAFTTSPEPREWPVDPAPPPDRILSALLANQGFNSGRIIKGGGTFLQVEGSVNLIQENEE